MKNFLKVVFFSMATVAFFSGFANLGIPEINPAPPPVEEVLDLGAMSLDEFIALGERLFTGKGTCNLCHEPIGGRAPLLDKITSIAEERLADSRYKGQATDAESYIYESMVEPSAFVVVGFGKSGSNDTESPMPAVSGGGMAFSEAEMLAIIAYLQDLEGVEVTVEIPTEVDTAPEEPASAEAPAAEAPPRAATPEAAMTQYGCGGCHEVAGQAGALGPKLNTIGALRDAAYLRRSLLDPNADIAEGYPPNLMPNIYGDQMSARELEMIVDYLASLK